MRRSEMLATSHSAIASVSAAKATGSAWKLPPDSESSVSGNNKGLSVTAFASIRSDSVTFLNKSRQAPITCGWQRKL